MYDIDKVVAGGANGGLVGKVPVPGVRLGGRQLDASATTTSTWGTIPPTSGRVLRRRAAGGYYVYDVTNLADPKLLTSITGIAGVQLGHTFTPDSRRPLRGRRDRVPVRAAPDLRPEAGPGRHGKDDLPADRRLDRHAGRACRTTTRSAGRTCSSSGYEDGLQVFNMMDPTNPYTVGYYDTYDGPHDKGLDAGPN